MVQVSRRAAIFGAVGGGAVPGALGLRNVLAPAVPKGRVALPVGIRSGDVTASSATLWGAADRPGELRVRLTSNGRRLRSIRGASATADTDLTARHTLTGLAPGREYEATMWFEDAAGKRGEEQTLRFATAPVHPAPQNVVWSGDVCGQGWGINEELGGMRSFASMLDVQPDLFLHCGDTIYADEPIAASALEPDFRHLWRSTVAFGVDHVAETLADFRGRHRYNLLDEHVRAFNLQVPTVATWDDHETTNNWWHGETLDDPRYTVRDVDTLAARGRQAWQEYMPITDSRALRKGTGFEPARIYRKIERGPQLDVFALDMRTFKGENTPGLEPHATSILGEEQLQWLIREVTRSKATWKVISSDLPLGIIVPDGKAQESIANRDNGAPLGRELELARLLKAFKDNKVKNVVWLTADVHYCAAHHYSPERAAFKDFDPFWEFVAGPINAGSFGPNDMDLTFGPEVVFSKAGYTNQSPRTGEGQFFGHVELDEDDTFTVSLRDAAETVLWRKALRPRR
jgi:alkaline phosphatase D